MSHIKNGYIKINRALLYHPSLTKHNRSFCEIGAFIWLLLEASFADREYRINNIIIKLKRGQICCSLSYIAEAWNWNKSKVQRFFDKLIENQTITTDTPTDTPANTPNVVTICNYDIYQDIPNNTPNNTKHNKLDIINYNKFNDLLWNKVKIKRGSKEKAFKAWDKLNNKIDNDLLVNKFNELINNTEDKKFVPHLSTWINDKRWEEDLDVPFGKTQLDNEFGFIQRDPFRNLFFWKKGRKMPNDIDSDIEIMHKKGEVSDEAMKQMGFSI